jgi:hypothetical protein
VRRFARRELRALVADLGSDSAARAGGAVDVLVAAGDQAVAALDERLRPADSPQLRRIGPLVAALDSDEFEERERATTELRQLGRLAEPALFRVLHSEPSAEVVKRSRALLEALGPQELTAEQVQLSRCLEVLQRIGNQEAVRLLRTLAEGASEAWLTQEARTSMHRLTRRPSMP